MRDVRRADVFVRAVEERLFQAARGLEPLGSTKKDTGTIARQLSEPLP